MLEKPITILVPAVGQSVRYRSEGYAVRKPFLVIRNRHGEKAMMVSHVLAQIPPQVDVIVAVPDGYEYEPLRPMTSVIPIEQTQTQEETILRMLESLRGNPSVMTMDADTICPVAGMLEWIKWSRPSTAMATVTIPEEGMSRLGVVSMRYFNSAELLRAALIDGKSLDDTLEANNAQSYKVPWFEDWGSPAKLEKAGASIA